MPDLNSLLKKLPRIELDESKKKGLLIYGAAALLFSAAYFFFFLKPTLTQLFDSIPKVAKRRVEIRIARTDLLSKDKLKKKLLFLEKGLAGYEKRLSREKELPQLLENLSEIARTSKVKILSITPLNQVVRSRPGAHKEIKMVYREIPIRITAQSGYHELGTFINALEKDDRYMQITDIKIKSKHANPRRHDIEFVVYMYTFKSSE